MAQMASRVDSEAPPLKGNELAPEGVGFLLGVAHRARRRSWEAELVDLELTAPQAAVLRLIAAQPGSGVRRLARELGTDVMNAQRIVKTLVAAGLCEQELDPLDARRRPLRPTEQGSKIAQVVARRALDSEERLAETLGALNYRTLLANLRALIEPEVPVES